MSSSTTSPPPSRTRRRRSKGASDGTFMAGGQTLIPTLKQRLASPSDVIDLGGIAELSGIRKDGNDLVIGAMTTHAEVAASDTVKQAIPALAAWPRASAIRRCAIAAHRRIGRQQRPGGRLSGGSAGARRHGADRQPHHRGRRLLHRPVRDGAERGRVDHRDPLPDPGEGELPEVPQPGQPLCHGRRHGGPDLRRRPRRGDRRRRPTACSAPRTSRRRWRAACRPARSTALPSRPTA